MVRTRSETDRDAEARAQIAAGEEAEAKDRTRAFSLFDLRRVIGGLIGAYGVLLTVMGLVASGASKSKAAGININLWAGVIMLACGGLFLAWALLRPLRAEKLEEPETNQTDRPRSEVGAN
jgi:hypothetical protein